MIKARMEKTKRPVSKTRARTSFISSDFGEIILQFSARLAYPQVANNQLLIYNQYKL